MAADRRGRIPLSVEQRFTKGHMTAENSDTAMKIYLREIGRVQLLTPRRRSSSQEN
jgi:hypothetical protein